MFKVISDIMTHWYELMMKFIITINFCNTMKMNCALMFMISNHYGTNCLSNLLLQLSPCNDMIKVISDKMAHWYEMIKHLLSQCKENKLYIDVKDQQ